MTHEGEPNQVDVKMQIGHKAIPYQDIANQHVARMMLEEGSQTMPGSDFFHGCLWRDNELRNKKGANSTHPY